jgi:hypothetical protein
MNNIKIIFSLLSICLIAISSCKKDEEDEQENLNTVTLKLTEGVNSLTFKWTDTDGTGGNAPKIDTIKIAPNKTYNLSVEVSDASVTTAKDYTEEIKAESNEHLFVHIATGNISFENLSKDANGKPFGQTVSLKSGAAGNGTLQIILKHEADKSAADPSKTGETDIDVILPVVIK